MKLFRFLCADASYGMYDGFVVRAESIEQANQVMKEYVTKEQYVNLPAELKNYWPGATDVSEVTLEGPPEVILASNIGA